MYNSSIFSYVRVNNCLYWIDQCNSLLILRKNLKKLFLINSINFGIDIKRNLSSLLILINFYDLIINIYLGKQFSLYENSYVFLYKVVFMANCINHFYFLLDETWQIQLWETIFICTSNQFDKTGFNYREIFNELDVLVLENVCCREA